MIKKEIGADLRRLRVKRKLTQEALAHSADISISFLKKLEGGLKQPSALTIFKLAYALNATPNDLILSTFEKWRDQQD